MNVPKPLHIEDIQPYMSGNNVLELTNSNSADQPVEVFTGEVSKILPAESKGAGLKVSIKMEWIVRIRKPIADKGLEAYEDFDPMPNSWHTNYLIVFEDPVLIQKRSPLTFRSENAVIKISHVTNLAKVVLWIKNRDEMLKHIRA